MLRATLLALIAAVVTTPSALADTDLFTISGPDSTEIVFTGPSTFPISYGAMPLCSRGSIFSLVGSGTYDGVSGYTFFFTVSQCGLHDYGYAVPAGGIPPPYYDFVSSSGSVVSETVTSIPDPYQTPPYAYIYDYSFVPGTYTGSVTALVYIPVPPAYLPFLSGPWSLTIAPLATASTPEPSGLLLLGSGLIAAGLARLRRRLL